MGDIQGFIKYSRKDFSKEAVDERKQHWKEFVRLFPAEDIKTQGARCMDCGIPFCQSGCPIDNIIPDWNDLVYRNQWHEALLRLHKTNNFPEFTGRICPAPCENSCVLTINKPAVTIKNIELSIIEKAFEIGAVKPQPPRYRTGRTAAIVGSGPAGLAAADQLNKLGHTVTVFEKNEDIGGLLTFGIPDFKLEKWVVQRRVELMADEGVIFKSNIHVGKNISAKEIIKRFDAVVLAGGAEEPRDLPVPGRELEGVYQAMFYLPQQNRRNKGQSIAPEISITAKDKRVIILGGGDTGSDCVGTANRQGAAWVKQFELMSQPPSERAPDNPWPQWALIERTSSSQEEGVERDYSIMTKKLSGKNGKLQELHAVRLEFGDTDPKTGQRPMKEIPRSEFKVECDMLILAMGFLGSVKKGLLEEMGVELDERKRVITDNDHMSNIEGVFAAGDMRIGQSLIVRAINEGRDAARGVHKWLMRYQ